MNLRELGNGTTDPIDRGTASGRDVVRAFDRAVSPHSAGISWSAVIAGAFVTAALALILLSLGAGFELSAVSPWSDFGEFSSKAGAAAIVWLIATQVIASAMGGYLAGRLRTKWHAIHSDEIHFRDTANGFVMWAVSMVVAVAFLGTAAVSMAGGSRSNGQNATAGRNADTIESYFADRLLRSDHPGGAVGDPAAYTEARLILETDLHRHEFPQSDTSFLASLVSLRTGLSEPAAQTRVGEVVNDLRVTEDAARKATSHLLLWAFLALLIGAFCASYAATIGGRQRDHVRTI